MGMDPDHALARLILVDIAEGKSSRVMKDAIKPWWVQGLAMANGSPKEISWRDMFPICARLIKQYEKAVPDASRHIELDTQNIVARRLDRLSGGSIQTDTYKADDRSNSPYRN